MGIGFGSGSFQLCSRFAKSQSSFIGVFGGSRQFWQISQLKYEKLYNYRTMSTSKQEGGNTSNDGPSRQSGLSKVAQGQAQVTISEKVKQTTKDVYYTGIIVIGVGITGVIGYYIFRELFSSQSPNGVYTGAFKLCRDNPKIVDAVGEPMKGYGELSSRGRRRHVSHVEFMQDDVRCMRMKFYIEGSRRKGTVHLEVRKNESGKYDYRYMFVELDGYPRETIIVQDNR